MLAKAFRLRELFLKVRNLGRLTRILWEVRFGGTPKPARCKRALPGFRDYSRSGRFDHDYELDT